VREAVGRQLTLVSLGCMQRVRQRELDLIIVNGYKPYTSYCLDDLLETNFLNNKVPNTMLLSLICLVEIEHTIVSPMCIEIPLMKISREVCWQLLVHRLD
jgi:hypothetical protein